MRRLTNFSFRPSLKNHVRSNLSGFKDLRQSTEGKRQAAVAITICQFEGESSVVVTRRSSKLKEHSGQWALPGGRVDDNETLVAAALRELEEEVNIKVEDEAVLGTLDDYITRSGYVITPIVIFADLEKNQIVGNPSEVASVHFFSFTELNRKDSPNLETIPQSDRQVLSMNYLDDRIYAPTAAMLYQFREVAILGRATRVLDFDQPLFAWR
ncbi:CoA pyrophosphatase [Gammaproteobacteria bacterium]|nr:CoA pyrophosphatase [Gammaproteobacteria bacterium]